MRIKDLMDENFQDYKKTSMFICTAFCDGKCYKELGLDCSLCQNNKILSQVIVDVPDEKIVQRYINNPITKAIVIGGLEPFEQYEELFNLISKFREKINDDIVIYTGFYKNEIEDQVEKLKQFPNIIIKYGRYIPNKEPKYDPVLEITLANPEQYVEKIS